MFRKSILFATARLPLFLLLSIFLAPISFAQTKFRPSEKSYKWAAKQLKKMTVDEKIGQLVHIGINARYLNQDSADFKELQRQVVESKIGGVVIFVGGVYETVHLVNRMQALAKIPLLISADFETGVGMRFDETVNFPWNMAIAATGNPDFARRQGEIVAREARALGVQQVFAPVVDVNNNGDNPVINVRSYGENPVEVARFGVAFTKGLQSGNILATAKHFPGHGDTNVDSHRGLPVIDLPRSRLDAVELVPFRAVFDAGIGSVMIAHISLPQIDPEVVTPLRRPYAPVETNSEIVNAKVTVPSTLSKIVTTQILQKELGFDGLIVTDAMSMSGLTIYFDQDEAAVRAIEAGVDIILKPADTDAAIRGLKNAFASKRISEERINQSVLKQLAWKHALGISKKFTTPIEEIDRIVSGNQTRALANEIAESAITLVKSDAATFPLERGKKICFIGSTNGEERMFLGMSFQQEMRRLGVRFEAAILDERSTPEEINIARTKAMNSETIIVGMFGRVRSGARNSVGLPDSNIPLLREIFSSEKNVVGISFGNPYLLRSFPEMKNYVAAYGDMPSLQRATTRALLGEIPFKGKLPITISK